MDSVEIFLAHALRREEEAALRIALDTEKLNPKLFALLVADLTHVFDEFSLGNGGFGKAPLVPFLGRLMFLRLARHNLIGSGRR